MLFTARVEMGTIIMFVDFLSLFKMGAKQKVNDSSKH
jgi:hypothetical protein